MCSRDMRQYTVNSELDIFSMDPQDDRRMCWALCLKTRHYHTNNICTTEGCEKFAGRKEFPASL